MHNVTSPAAARAIGAALALAAACLGACDQSVPAPTVQLPPQPATPTAPGTRSAAAESTAPEREQRPPVAARPAPARTPGTVRLATYNVENLFDDVDDPGLTGRYDDREETKPFEHRRAAAEAIRAIDADILALQEIESRDALLWFRDEFLSDLGYEHVVSLDAGDERGIEQAVLSRFPLSDPAQWIGAPLGGTHPDKWGSEDNYNAGKPITLHRSPLRVTVTIPAGHPVLQAAPGGPAREPYALTLFVVHQKSGGPGGYWRVREATKTAELVREFEQGHPGANIAVLGDFNCQPHQDEFRPYLDAGFLDACQALRAGPRDLQVTHASQRVIDMILVTPRLEPELVPGSAFVFPTPQRSPDVDWRTTPPPPGYAADHFPVAVDLVPLDRAG